MKNEKTELYKKMASMLLKMSGADVVCPEPLLKAKLQEANIEESIKFHQCQKEIKNITSQDEKFRVIKSLVWSNLTQTQLQELVSDISETSNEVLDFILKNPEYQNEVNPEDLGSFLK